MAVLRGGAELGETETGGGAADLRTASGKTPACLQRCTTEMHSCFELFVSGCTLFHFAEGG